MNEPLRETPLIEEHRALGARLVPFAGWRMPVQYAGIKQEHAAVRNQAGLFDVSHMGELFIEGAEALQAVDALITNDASELDVGRAMYTVCCNDEGFILDDLIVYRVGAERVMVVCNASNRDKIAAHFQSRLQPGVRFEDASDRMALLAVQGPRAEAILKGLGAPGAVTSLESFRVVETELDGVGAIVARTGYTGEDGFEMFCASDQAAALWRAIMRAGEAHGLAPVGLGARDTLRLEARLMLYGNDIDETTHPFEAGLGWVVKLDGAPFVGRDALATLKKAGLDRRLVGLEMTGRGIARHGYPIVADGRVVGTVTSGSPGPTVGRNIGLGYVPKGLSRVGTTLGIEIRGKVVDAVVVRTPFYKR
ncbi:MAG: glycine cleavage system aminomethyltransferase GcvT [Myxococcota bacterium]